MAEGGMIDQNYTEKFVLNFYSDFCPSLQLFLLTAAVRRAFSVYLNHNSIIIEP